jgi:hypothetical protein
MLKTMLIRLTQASHIVLPLAIIVQMNSESMSA